MTYIYPSIWSAGVAAWRGVQKCHECNGCSPSSLKLTQWCSVFLGWWNSLTQCFQIWFNKISPPRRYTTTERDVYNIYLEYNISHRETCHLSPVQACPIGCGRPQLLVTPGLDCSDCWSCFYLICFRPMTKHAEPFSGIKAAETTARGVQ